MKLRRSNGDATSQPKDAQRAAAADARRGRVKLLILVLLGVVAAVVLPQRLTGSIVESTNFDGEKTRTEAAMLRERAADAGVVKANRDDFDRRAETALTQLPREAELGPLMLELRETIEERSGMTWLSGSTAELAAPEGSSTQRWNLEVSVRGTESRVAGLVTNISEMKRLVTISSIATQAGDNAGEIVVNLTLTFYALGGGS